MGSQKSSTGGNNPQARPLSPFEFMDKYRVPILAVCAFALVGFGVWTAILGAVDPGPEGRKDPEEVMATFNVGDNEHSVTRQNLYEAYVGSNSDSSAVYGAKLSQLIRQAMVEDLSVFVSEEEVRRGLGSYKERLKSANDGKFDKDLYTKIINRKYHCQISQSVPPPRFAKKLILEVGSICINYAVAGGSSHRIDEARIFEVCPICTNYRSRHHIDGKICSMCTNYGTAPCRRGSLFDLHKLRLTAPYRRGSLFLLQTTCRDTA